MADYDNENDRYLGEPNKGLIGKKKDDSGGLWDWLTKKSQGKKAQAADNSGVAPLDPQGVQSLKDAFK